MLTGKKILLIVLLLVICFPNTAFPKKKEYEVKAVFLERFTRFIDWPESAQIDDPLKPFVIGVIGKHPFGDLLDRIYAERKIKDKAVEIRYVSKVEEILQCHLLFISASAKAELSHILSTIKDKPILTVGDSKGFSEKGVHIDFYLDEGRVRFAINESAVRQSGLQMSYRLLQSARIVNPVKGE